MYAPKLKELLPRIDRNTPIAVFDDYGLICDTVLAGELPFCSVAEYLDTCVRTIQWNRDDQCLDIELCPFDAKDPDNVM